MNARTWTVFGIMTLTILGLGAVHRLTMLHPAVTLHAAEGQRTWLVLAKGGRVELPGVVRPDDALICLLDGPAAQLERLDDIYEWNESRKVWIEGERVENPPEGGAGPLFDREPIGRVWAHCGEEQPHAT